MTPSRGEPPHFLLRNMSLVNPQTPGHSVHTTQAVSRFPARKQVPLAFLGETANQLRDTSFCPVPVVHVGSPERGLWMATGRSPCWA